MVNRFNSP